MKVAHFRLCTFVGGLNMMQFGLIDWYLCMKSFFSLRYSLIRLWKSLELNGVKRCKPHLLGGFVSKFIPMDTLMTGNPEYGDFCCMRT